MIKSLEKHYKRLIILIEIILFIVLIVLAYNFTPSKKGTHTFYLPASDINTTISTLQKNGYEMTAIDKWILGLKKIPDEGWYSIKPNKYGRIPFFYTFYKQKTDALMDVVVFAGETKDEVCGRLANDTKTDKQKLLNAYNDMTRFTEADIIAGRYTLARKANEKTAIHYLFMTSEKTLEGFKKEYFTKPLSESELKVIYIVASIIQKESNSLKELPLISSVIYNRLEKNMRLQMDSTLNYGEYSHVIVTPERIKSDASAFNTYKHKGLPPQPLGSVTLDALKAAAKPSPTEFLYFMLNEKGSHDFSANYTEHIANIKIFRAYLDEKKMKEEQKQEIQKQEDTNKTINILTPSFLGDTAIEIDWQKVKL